VAILLGVVLFAARWCRAGPWLSVAVCAVALAGFVILARPSPSVIRAAAMGSIGLLALATGRSRAAMPALAAAVVVGLLIDPALAVDPGFALSVLATGALVLLAPAWSAGLADRGVPRGLAEALAVPAAAQLACGPVIVALSGQVSLVAVPANLLAAPAVAPATLLGVAAALVSPLWSDGAALLAWLASWPARWLVAIATTGAAIPDGTIPWPGGVWGGLGLAGLTVGLLVAGRRPAARRLLLAAALAVAVGAVPVRLLASGWPPENAVIVACDVGQGDALVLPDGPGDAVVVDSGPEPAAVAACLHRLGIHSVAAVVLTHFHIDHVGGVTGVFDGHQVGAVVLPAFHEPDTGYRAVLDAAAQHRVAITAAGVGWTLRRGDLELRAIGPTRALTGTRSDPNNNSLVLRATSHGVSVLLEGDAETEEQGELLADADHTDLRADVLKVAHHGSAYQDPALLELVHPAVALVSVGVGNPYGHPNPGLLAALTRGGVRVLRTDQDGDVAVVAAEDGLAVVQARSPPTAADRYPATRRHGGQLRPVAASASPDRPCICDGYRATLQALSRPWAIGGRRASMAAWQRPERRVSSSVTKSCWSRAGSLRPWQMRGQTIPIPPWRSTPPARYPCLSSSRR
jgi:competence protein ComEC